MFLRKATAAQPDDLGPFVDDTDFKSAETGLTIANTDIKLIKVGGASVNKNSGGGTHRANGFYGVTWDATDTGTVGFMTASVVVAGALPVFKRYYVLEQVVYDAVYGVAAGGYAPAATALSTAQWTNARAAYLDNVNNAALAGAAFPVDPASGSTVSASFTTAYAQLDAILIAIAALGTVTLSQSDIDDIVAAITGSASDPWSTSLPGAYTGTQAGKLVGDRITAISNLLDTLEITLDPTAIAALLASALEHGGTVGDALESALATGFGKMVIDTVAKTMKLYAPDETTVLVTHDLTPSAAAATTRNPR